MKMSYQGHLGTRPCTSGEPWDLDSKPWTYRRLPTKRHGRAKPFAASCTCQPSLNKSVCSCNPPSMTEAQSGAARSWCAKSKGAINELQQTGNTKHQRQKKSKKKKNNDDSSSSSSSSSSYHILSLFKSPWPPWAPVKNNPTKHGIWAMDDIVGGLIFLPIISLAWRRRFICDLQLDPVASSPRPGHCFSSNGTNF